MYSEEELFRGLRKAHEAGDTRAATLFANKIAELRKSKSINQQTPPQQQAPVKQAPVQQNNVTNTVAPKKEEPGFLEGVKNFFFGDEEKKPKAELISEKFVEQKPETPYVFKPTTTSLLDKEYNQKIKAVEEKYNALQEDPKNKQIQSYGGFAPPTVTYKVDYNKQKEQEILSLNAEKLKKEGRNLNPQEQLINTSISADNIKKNQTKIETLSKQKKSYLDELNKENVTDSPDFFSSWNKIIKTVKNTWEHNSNIDGEIAQAEENKKIQTKQLNFAKKGVDPNKNRDVQNAEDIKKGWSYFDPSVESASKKAREKIGEVTTKIFPSAEKGERKSGLDILGTGLNFLVKGVVGGVSELLTDAVRDYIKVEKFTNLTPEQLERQAIEKSYRGYEQTIDAKLNPIYDKIQSDLSIPKTEVAKSIDKFLNLRQGLNVENIQVSDNEKKLFTNPDFIDLADAYSKTTITQILGGKKRLLSMANIDLYMDEKNKAFGNINKVENIGKKAAVQSAILDKNVEEEGILSEAGFNKMLYNTAWSNLKAGDFTVNQTASAAQILSQVGSASYTGKASTPEWTEKIINNTDLFDNLVQEDSHFKLSIFKDDKYIDKILPSGDKVKVQYDSDGNILNAFGGEMEYTINNPEIMQWLANDIEQNKEEYLKNGTSLWDTEGGKAVFLENAWNSAYKEIVEEMPSLLVEAGAGRIAGGIINAIAKEQRAQNLAKGANFMINVASSMTENYPSIYKKYQEAAEDKDNPFPALVSSGALALGTLVTSHLQNKAIGLTSNDVNKVVIPNAIESSLGAIRAIRKEFAKIPDATLRDKFTNAAIRKVMFQNIMSISGKVLRESSRSAGEEAAEETILEPLINVGANFINEKITGDKSYNQETLKDLGFLDPDVAITSALTGGTLSSGMDLVKSMSSNAPFSKEDYLKTAFENEATFTSMVDIMTQSPDNNFKEEDQIKMMADYKALRDSYNARKAELGVNDEALSTLNFSNPVIKSFANSIGVDEKSLNKLNSGRTFDNAIIRQSLNERELAEKKIALDEEVAKGNISVSSEGTYKTVGSNPLTGELAKQISEYEQLQLSNNNLTTFIDTFNKETKPVQKQYIAELNQVTSEAPDLIRAKNNKEGSFAYKAVSNAIMDKQMAISQLEQVNTDIDTATIDGADTTELQAKKQTLEKAIKASDKTITTLKKQYKAGRFDAQNETIDRYNDFRTAAIVLEEKLESMANIDATDEDIEQSDINDAYADYLDAFKALKKSNSALKKEYGVEVFDSKATPMSLEDFQTSKNNIKEKNALSKNLGENKGTLGDVERLIDLEYTTGAKKRKDRLEVTTPKTKEEIKDILEDKEQVYEYAKRLGLENKKSYAQTKKAVKAYLTKQLSTQDETLLEGVSAIFVEKIIKQKNGNPMFEVEGQLYKPAGYSVSPTMMTQEERNTVLTNAVISEIAKQVFNNSLLLTPYNISQIINKVIIESGFDTEVGIDNRSLQFIAETILALKSDLDAQGFAYKFNDDVVISKLSEDAERGYEGIATTPILTVVDTEGNVHLIDFKSYSNNYAASTSSWADSLTEMQAIFQDNGITVASINVVPIRVNNSFKTENGLTNLFINKNSFNEIIDNDNSISRTLLEVTTSEPILTTLEEEGLLTEEELESFDEIPLDEEDTPITNADNLNEDSLVVFESENDIESKMPFSIEEYDEILANKYTEISDNIVNALKEKIKNNIQLAPREMDIIVFSKGFFTEEEVKNAQGVLEINTTDATEEDIKVEDKNKATKTAPRKVVEETAQGFMAGLGKGVYIQVKSHEGGFYTIKIFGDTELANKYGKKRMSLEDLKAVYKYNNWFMPKSFEGTGTYQLLNADTQTPVLSKNYVDFVQPNGFNEVINDITVAADIIGTGVEIVENNESGYNDTDEVQKDFKNKASLSIVNENGEKIAMVAPNSPLRDKLKITNKKGLNRLQPTIATIKDVQFNDFNRAPIQFFEDWEQNAIASGVLVPGEYEMVYIGIEDKKRVFKNQNGVVVPGKVPANAPLGSSYLFMTNFPKKNIIIPMITPKLAELGYTKEDIKTILDLIDRNSLTKNDADAEGIYSNFIAALNAISDTQLKNPKLKELKNFLSNELGGKKLELRASSTQSQIDKLDSILPYTEGNTDLNDSILTSFLLDRIITMNAETLGSHKIGVNPNILFADNALVLDNVKAKPKPRKQVLSSTVAKNKNTDLVKETYYEPFMTETEDGNSYVFFHKSNAAPEELAKGIDSRRFFSLRTSRTEKGTQYGVASYYTLPKDGERAVSGETYMVTVPKKKVYPMDSDPNGYKSAAEAMVPENTPFRMENIKKQMVRMAAEDGYLMAVGMWYFDPTGDPVTGPALRADAIVPLVPQTVTYRKATDKQIDHPLKKIFKAMEELRPIVNKFESERNSNRDYKEAYFIAQDTRMGKIIPTNDQFEIMVAGLPESMNADIERARELINTLRNTEDTPSANNEVASATMSAVIGRLKETGLANEVFEMSNDEIVEKLVELGVEEGVAKQVVAYHGSPYEFDKFTSEKIGTGEGAQAFGWGLYFTDLESIARNYAEKLANPDTDNFDLDGYFYRKDTEYDPDIMEETVTYFKNEIQITEEEFLKAKEKSPNKKLRNLYKVTLFKDKTPDQYTWLEWDKSFSDSNINKIKSQFEKEGIPKEIDSPLNETMKLLGKQTDFKDYRPNPIRGTTKDFYENLVKYFLSMGIKNPQKEVSLFLLRAGIDGIKYPAESISRGATSETARGFNYVVFDENAVTIEEKIKFQKELSDNNITPTTAGFVYDGDVYLNMDKMNLDTPIHEFGHLWLSWAKNNLGQAYARGLELAKSAEAEPYRQYVMETQPDLKVDSEAFLEEVLAQAIGDNGARLVEENSTKTKSWLQELWDSIGKMLGLSQYTADQIMNMTINDYAKAVAVDLLSGRELAGPVETTQEVQKSELVAAGNRLFNNPLPEATTIAEKYNEENGLAPMVDNTITKIDKPFATRIAKAYDEMEATPFETETQESYKALIDETIAQHRAILAEGFQVEINDFEPYANAQEMIDDLRENKRMKIFSTESGFGGEVITDEQRQENPLLQETEFKDINNVPLLANDVFRFVHDFFGHAKLGNGFGPVGEENAWRVHVQMYSPEARKAITTETRGQNSWVNFSGANDEAFKMRDKARKLRQEGKIEEAAQLSEQVYGMMRFADQKVGILPEWAYEIPSENIDDITTIPDCV